MLSNSKREDAIQNLYEFFVHCMGLFSKKRLLFYIWLLPPSFYEGSGVEAFASTTFDASLNWKDIEWLTSVTKLPVLVKGILTREDALKAIEAGVDGIVVSNHGDRQLDYSPATITVLEEIVHIVGGRVSVLLDGEDESEVEKRTTTPNKKQAEVEKKRTIAIGIRLKHFWFGRRRIACSSSVKIKVLLIPKDCMPTLAHPAHSPTLQWIIPLGPHLNGP
ncbi:unnamed protein product [Brassica oleracea]